MPPLMRMHEGLLSTWCNSWRNGSLWPWSRLESLQKFGRQSFFSYMTRTSGLNKSGWICIKQWCWIDKGFSPIKMRICNLHFFASIWMAQPIVHNFRRMSVADLKPREPDFISYKEGWYKWDGRGKQEEEAFAGHTMG